MKSFIIGLLFYVLILLQFVLNFAWINIYIPFCPSSYIANIASEQFCNCYLWQVVVVGGIILFTLILLFRWESYYNKHYPWVLYFFIALFVWGVTGVSLDAINGLIGAIGPQTLMLSSLWVLGAVWFVYSSLYSLLVLKVSSTYKSIIVAVLVYLFSMGLIINKLLYVLNLSLE